MKNILLLIIGAMVFSHAVSADPVLAQNISSAAMDDTNTDRSKKDFDRSFKETTAIECRNDAGGIETYYGYPGEIDVQFKASISQKDETALIKKNKGTIVRALNGGGFYFIKVPVGRECDFVRAMRKDLRVRWAEFSKEAYCSEKEECTGLNLSDIKG